MPSWHKSTGVQRDPIDSRVPCLESCLTCLSSVSLPHASCLVLHASFAPMLSTFLYSVFFFSPLSLFPCLLLVFPVCALSVYHRRHSFRHASASASPSIPASSRRLLEVARSHSPPLCQIQRYDAHVDLVQVLIIPTCTQQSLHFAFISNPMHPCNAITKGICLRATLNPDSFLRLALPAPDGVPTGALRCSASYSRVQVRSTSQSNAVGEITDFKTPISFVRQRAFSVNQKLKQIILCMTH